MKITTKVSSTVATFKNTDKICELIIRYCCYLDLIFGLAYWVYFTDGEYHRDMRERADEKHNEFLHTMVGLGGKILGEIDRIQRFSKASYGFDLNTLAHTHDRVIRFNDKIEETYDFYGFNLDATEYLAYILNSGVQSAIGLAYRDQFNTDRMEFKFLKSMPEGYLECMLYIASAMQIVFTGRSDMIGYFVDSKFEYKSNLTDRENMYRFVDDTIFKDFSSMTCGDSGYATLPVEAECYIRALFIKEILDLSRIYCTMPDKFRLSCEEILDYTKVKYVNIDPYKKRYPIDPRIIKPR